MSNKTKLELIWIGKENRPKREPRILLEDPEKSYHAAHRVTDPRHLRYRLIFASESHDEPSRNYRLIVTSDVTP